MAPVLVALMVNTAAVWPIAASTTVSNRGYGHSAGRIGKG
jgi:hypothetical protein